MTASALESRATPRLSRRTARVTGLWYLAMVPAGMIGYLMVRSQILDSANPSATLANLLDSPALARLGVTMELLLVLAQAMAAVWFYRLFREVRPAAAWAVAAFGMGNAMAIMASVAFTATALAVVGSQGMAPGGDVAATVQLLYQLSEASWGAGSVFFGLWLIPMGHLALVSGAMPVWLGRILIIGGVGYVLSAFAQFGVPGAPLWLGQVLPVPATIGEFWMIGYLLFGRFGPRAAYEARE